MIVQLPTPDRPIVLDLISHLTHLFFETRGKKQAALATSRSLFGSKGFFFFAFWKNTSSIFSSLLDLTFWMFSDPHTGISYRGFHAGCYFPLQLFSGLPIDRVHNLAIFENRVRKNCDLENRSLGRWGYADPSGSRPMDAISQTWFRPSSAL